MNLIVWRGCAPYCFSFLVVTGVMGSAYSQSTPSLTARIRTIESGLTPPVEVVGERPVRLSLLQEMKARHVPGLSIAMVHNGSIEWSKGYGIAKNGVPISPKTLFQAASLSKSLTATAALLLVERNELKLDEPIQTYLKSWKLPKSEFVKKHAVTLRELLSNTAGVNVSSFEGYPSTGPIPTLLQILNGEKPANSEAVKVEDVPGSQFNYSGGGFVIAQQAMIDATGMTFPEILSHLVFEPLGMSKSTYEQPLSTSRLGEAAMPFDAKGAPIPEGPFVYPELAPAGLWTTPSEFAKWILEMQRAFRGKSFLGLSSKNAQLMITPVKEAYALGVETHGSDKALAFSHSGANAGYRAYFFAYPKGDGVVIMTNGENGNELIMELVRSISKEYKWSDFRTAKRVRAIVPLVEQTKFVGKFEPSGFFPFEISLDQKELRLVMAGGSPSALLPSSPNSFFIREGVLQIKFDSADRGELIFDKQIIPFKRVR